MIEKPVNSISTWLFSNLLKYGNIHHFISGRIGGTSSPPYDSLNLGFHVGDDPREVLGNRRVLASALGISLNDFVFAQQIHDSRIKVVTTDERGNGAIRQETALEATDALVTHTHDICIILLVGDCVPVLFFDPNKNVIGVAHAGWRGTVRMIARNTVRVFQERFGCSPEDIVVGIGPSIGPCCYEVGPEVIDEVESVHCSGKGLIETRTHEGRGHLNLWEANKIQLMEAGVPEGNIETAEMCTYCNHRQFFSRRYQKGETGRFGAGIMLKAA